MTGAGGQPALQPAARVLAQAAHAVTAVVDAGRSADDALTAADASAQRAAVRAVTLGTLRWYLRLAPALAQLLTTPRTPPLLRALLSVGLHQLEYSRNRADVSVSASVDAARALGFARAAGMVNAVLRRFLRERGALWARVDRDLPPASAHPGWLVSALQAAWPQDYAAVLAANNAHPPLCLRVDLTRTRRVDYLARLQEQGLDAHLSEWLDCALTLMRAVPVTQLPGFEDGLVSVQDAGAQWAARLLQVQRGDRVLDACAAPGGKTGALLEAAAGAIELVAIDHDASRVQLIDANLRRLGREAQLRVADLTVPGWTDGAPFDRILVDAPCSAVGVIRRHPDIKLLRRPEDVVALGVVQAAVLAQCFAVLKPGGRLVYCTCSVLPQENERIVAGLLATHSAACEAPLPDVAQPPGLRRCGLGWQLLPGGEAGTDGFYYACLTRS